MSDATYDSVVVGARRAVSPRRQLPGREPTSLLERKSTDETGHIACGDAITDGLYDVTGSEPKY